MSDFMDGDMTGEKIMNVSNNILSINERHGMNNITAILMVGSLCSTVASRGFETFYSKFLFYYFQTRTCNKKKITHVTCEDRTLAMGDVVTK